MKMLSPWPELVGVYKGVMSTNLSFYQYNALKCCYRHSLVINGSQKVQTRSDLKLRLVSLNDCADNGDVDVFGANVVSR